jgi:hypothetical protein
MQGLAQLALGFCGLLIGGLLGGLGIAPIWGAIWLAGPGLASGGLALVILLWLSLAGLALGGALGGWIGWRWAGQAIGGEPAAPEPRCGGCGYNLTGLVSARCPECGQPIAGA